MIAASNPELIEYHVVWISAGKTGATKSWVIDLAEGRTYPRETGLVDFREVVEALVQRGRCYQPSWDELHDLLVTDEGTELLREHGLVLVERP